MSYIYKLIPSSAPPPDPLPTHLPLSDLDESSGFIHLSTAAQVPGTLRRFFSSEPKVYVLRIPYDQVEKDIRWESPDAKGLFPHLYNNGRLGSGEVDSVAEWENANPGSNDSAAGWDDALTKAASWLI